jgi:hypothetical protein
MDAYADYDGDEEEGAGTCETCGEPASDRECAPCAEDTARVAAESRAERKAEGRAMASDMGQSSDEG